MTGESKVKGINNSGQRDNSNISIVKGGVNLVAAGEGIGRGKLCTRKDFPDNIKVLEEERPACLPA